MKIDEINDPSKTKSEWFRLIHAVLFPSGDDSQKEFAAEILSVKPIHRRKNTVKSNWVNDCVLVSKHLGGGIAKCTLNEEMLTEPTESRSTRWIRLQPFSEEDASKLLYTTGDHVGISPINLPEVVEGIAKLYNIGLNDILDFVSLKVPSSYERATEDCHSLKEREGYPLCEPLITSKAILHEEAVLHFPFPAPFYRIFGVDVDLTLRTESASRLLSLLIEYETDNNREKELIEILEKMKSNENSYGRLNYENVYELLCAFPNSRPPLGRLIDVLPRLRSRFYSISSSNRIHPNEIDLTVGLVHERRTDPTPVIFRGVCSTFLHNLVPNHSLVRLHVHPSEFRLPSTISSPTLMIGPGTGIAPLIAFCEEMELLLSEQSETSRFWLLHGCRTQHEILHRARLRSWECRGVLAKLGLAFSREQNQPKQYVQELIEANGDRIWEMMKEPNFHVYICGDGRMADGVLNSFMNVASTFGHLDYSEIFSLFERMKNENRYQTDVWGVTLNFQSAISQLRQERKQRSYRWVQQVMKFKNPKGLSASRSIG
jgi:sulfite reductase alpha subunit-like flavoprotein